MKDTPLADWSGAIGDEYFKRNPVTKDGVAIRANWLRKVLLHISRPPESILEIGAGQGDNLLAMQQLLPGAILRATEPNATARKLLIDQLPDCRVFSDSIQALGFGKLSYDMAFTNGCLIHVPPPELDTALSEIHRVARDWILICEYFAAKPEHVPWRGSHIWKCDFGGRLLELFPTLTPVACGFEWKQLTGMDHATWWLFRKPEI